MDLARRTREDHILGHGLVASEIISIPARSKIVSAIVNNRTNHEKALTAVIKILEKYQEGILGIFPLTRMAAWIAGARDVALKLPESALADLVGSGPPIVPLFPETRDGRPPKPLVEFPLLEGAQEFLEEKAAISKAVFQSLEAAAQREAFTIAGDIQLDTIERVKSLLIEDIKEGTSLKGFKQKVAESIEEGFIGPAHLETVYRTNVQTAFAEGHDKLANNPIVDEIFPFMEYLPISDGRVRDDHLELAFLGLNGTGIYWRNDPMWHHFRPPWDFNCRCGVNLLTKEQAAARGITQAIEWVETGKRPQPEHRLSVIPFRPSNDFIGPQTLSTIRMAAEHAPKGGVTVQGKFYKGGEFIPGDVLDKATDEEKKAIKEGENKEEEVKLKLGNNADGELHKFKVGEQIEFEDGGSKQSSSIIDVKEGWVQVDKDGEKTWIQMSKVFTDEDEAAKAMKAHFAKQKKKGDDDDDSVEDEPEEDFIELTDAQTGFDFNGVKTTFKQGNEVHFEGVDQKIEDVGINHEDEFDGEIMLKIDGEWISSGNVTAPSSQGETDVVPDKAEDTPIPKKNLGELETVQTLGGSTGAILVEDSHGTRYVQKKGNSKAHVAEEVTADNLYTVAGIKVPNIVDFDGTTKTTTFLQGATMLKDLSGEDRESAEDQIRQGFAMDALLANWDVVGASADNIMVRKTPSGKQLAFRIDNGGSLRFRAQGGNKGSKFGDQVGELDTMRQGHYPAGKLFGKLTDEQVAKQIEELEAKRSDILAATPKDLRDKIGKRMDSMKAWAKVVNDKKIKEEEAKVAAKAKVASPPKKGDGKSTGLTGGLKVIASWNKLLSQQEKYQLTDDQLTEMMQKEFPDRTKFQSVPQVRSFYNTAKYGYGTGAPIDKDKRLKKVKVATTDLTKASPSFHDSEASAPWEQPKPTVPYKEAHAAWQSTVKKNEPQIGAITSWKGSSSTFRKIDKNGGHSKHHSDATIEKYKHWKKALAAAPTYSGTTHRGLTLGSSEMQGFLDQFNEHDQFQFKADASSSKKRLSSFGSRTPKKMESGHVNLVMTHTQSGVDIHHLDGFSEEQEVTMKQGSRFQVKKIMLNPGPSAKSKGAQYQEFDSVQAAISWAESKKLKPERFGWTFEMEEVDPNVSTPPGDQ